MGTISLNGIKGKHPVLDRALESSDHLLKLICNNNPEGVAEFLNARYVLKNQEVTPEDLRDICKLLMSEMTPEQAADWFRQLVYSVKHNDEQPIAEFNVNHKQWGIKR